MVARSVQADAVERRFLVQEHHEIKTGLGTISDVAEQVGRFSSTDLASILSSLLLWLESSFEPHAAWEEAWLYPRLEALTTSPWPARLLSFDHDQIRERIEALKIERDHLGDRSTVRQRDLPRLLYGLDAMIRAHMECEDRFLVPLLDEPAPAALFS
jgi:hemerythrin-like domain-containing protein